MTHYPIAIFCYNRPILLNKLIISIKKNKNFKKHRYFFFCDGLKNKENKNLLSQNLNIIEKFNVKKKIIKRKTNLGLKKNIILGVSEVLFNNHAIIVLEDDLVLNSQCLEFLNFALNKFKSSNKIGSVTAHSYLDNQKKFLNIDWFKTYRHSSWGWGTYKRIWKNINWKHLENKEISKNENIKISRAGNNINQFIKANKKKVINSWATLFNRYCLNKDLLSVSPRFSLINNIGFGLSSTHNKNILRKKISKTRKKKLLLSKLQPPKLHKNINNFIRDSNKKNYLLELKLRFL